MSELSFVTIGNPAKILYLNPMRDSNGRYKTVKEWVKEIIGYHVEYWNIQYDESFMEGLAWMYNSIYDSIEKAMALCQYLYSTIVVDEELINIAAEMQLLLLEDFPVRIKEIVK